MSLIERAEPTTVMTNGYNRAANFDNPSSLVDSKIQRATPRRLGSKGRGNGTLPRLRERIAMVRREGTDGAWYLMAQFRVGASASAYARRLREENQDMEFLSEGVKGNDKVKSQIFARVVTSR